MFPKRYRFRRNVNETEDNTDLPIDTVYEESFFDFGLDQLDNEMDIMVDNMIQNVKDITNDIKNSTTNGNTTIYIINNNYCDPKSDCDEQQPPVQNTEDNPPAINATNINEGSYSSDKQLPVQNSEINPSPINAANINNGSYISDKQHSVQKREANLPRMNGKNINKKNYRINKQNLTLKEDYVDNLSISTELFYDTNKNETNKPRVWQKLFQKEIIKNGEGRGNRDDDKNNSEGNLDYSYYLNRYFTNNGNQSDIDYIDNNNRTKDSYIPSHLEFKNNNDSGVVLLF
ncbi:Hypothetical protein CINCED_3A006569 [Cinara cedri]|uniref:Uncharacterized protein n=1 Tax=Cinara cedri TaxID=506608 RepID=A0A5E4NBV9_9HEMI|nr:Hypothetical protein CINCED_3A006569 [Cinara cedri]